MEISYLPKKFEKDPLGLFFFLFTLPDHTADVTLAKAYDLKVLLI